MLFESFMDVKNIVCMNLYAKVGETILKHSCIMDFYI